MARIKTINRYNAIRDQAMAVLGTFEKQAAARTAWNSVNAAIVERANAKRPTPKVFEVHHEVETARKAFLLAVVDGHDMATCENAARAAVKLETI